MGKRKRSSTNKNIDKPYCWYCDRHFQDEKILVQHQKAKHFKCLVCHKKLSSASGMVVHMFQVHKETISKIPNAKPGRDSVRNDVKGMSGIPGEDEMMLKKPRLDNGEPDTVALAGLALYSGLPFGPFSMPYMPPGAPMPAPGYLGYPGYHPGMGPMPPIAMPTANIPTQPSPVSGDYSPNSASTAPYIPEAISPEPEGDIPGQVAPLFPLVNSQTPPQVTPITTPQNIATPTDNVKSQSKVELVYPDIDESVEEKRAALAKYNYSIIKTQIQMTQLDQAIESRIMGMGIPGLQES